MLTFARLEEIPTDATIADRLTWDLERAHGADRHWRYQRFAKLPVPFLRPVAAQYRSLWNDRGEQTANLFFLDLCERLDAFAVAPGADDDTIALLAKRIARRCREALARNRLSQTVAAHFLRVCDRYEVAPPPGLRDYVLKSQDVFPASTGTGTGRPATSAIATGLPVGRSTGTGTVPVLARPIIARVTDDAWWRRKLRTIHTRSVETEAIRLHLVHNLAGRYVSDGTLARHQQQRRRNQRVLASLVAENELGHTLGLDELAARSLSNPANRRSELMARVHGSDCVAKASGHSGVFLTMTCPSRMHSHQRANGNPNPRYDGETSPRDAQRYLAKVWSRIRAKLGRVGIHPYGMRIAEPHHDGTPHWHLLLFVEPAHLNALTETCRTYALADSPDEPGADEHRFRVELIDPTKGSATAYIAKYISKNIDGYGLNLSGFDAPPFATAERVAAWASTWRIRQFQQIGGPPVGLWRELRRAPELAEAPLVGPLAAAADRGEWSTFTRLLGGPQVRRKDLPIRLARAYDPRPGRYGEPIGLRVAGIEAGKVVFSTRFHTWSIRPKAPEKNCTQRSQLYPVPPSPEKEEGESVAASPPWSSVNNCTNVEEIARFTASNQNRELHSQNPAVSFPLRTGTTHADSMKICK